MARNKRKIAQTVLDPTLRTTEIEIAGTKYTLCFDLGALAEGEAHFRRQGDPVNLLRALPEPTLSSILTLFPCAIHKFHPELGFKDAQALLEGNLAVVYAVAPFVMAAWQRSQPDPKEATEPPPQP